MIISVTPKGLTKTQIFEKKGKVSSEEQILAYFFLVKSSLTSLGEQFVMVHKVIWHLLCKWLGHFLWRKRSLETNNSKRGNLPGDNQFWPIFSGITEHGRPYAPCYQAAQGLLAIIVQVTRSFL